MTEQEKIEKACKAHQFRSKKETFQAGASYYAKEVMPGQLAKAMEWISLKGLYQEIDGKWYDKFGGKVRLVAETTPELLKLFEKYKQKDNANEANKT